MSTHNIGFCGEMKNIYLAKLVHCLVTSGFNFLFDFIQLGTRSLRSLDRLYVYVYCSYPEL